MAASMALAAHALTGKSFPHCGPGQGCDEALASRWSSIGGWPVAYAALCYFAGATLAWMAARREGASTLLKYVVRLAALISAVYLVLSWQLHVRCWYCLAVHAANLSFWLLVETSPRSRDSMRSAMALVGGFAVLFAALTVYESERRWDQSALSTDKLDDDAATAADLAALSDLTVEVTVYTDYSCSICKSVDDELADLIEANANVVLSVRHYPLSTECNPHIGNNLHPNSCQAARVAEAARLHAGDASDFRRVHRWLFERDGQFTTDELRVALPTLGFSDVEAFLETVGSPEIDRRIQTDLRQAKAAGVDGTPTLFVNGGLLRNWKEGALKSAIWVAARRKAGQDLVKPDPGPGR